MANERCRIMNHIITSKDNMYKSNVFKFHKDDMRAVGNLPNFRTVIELYVQYQGMTCKDSKTMFCRKRQKLENNMLMDKQTYRGPFFCPVIFHRLAVFCT